MYHLQTQHFDFRCGFKSHVCLVLFSLRNTELRNQVIKEMVALFPIPKGKFINKLYTRLERLSAETDLLKIYEAFQLDLKYSWDTAQKFAKRFSF